MEALLDRQEKFIKFKELVDDRILACLHFRHGAEETCIPFMEKYDPVRQLLGQPHVVSHDDAGEVELVLQALYQIAQEMAHERIHHGRRFVV